MDVASHVLVVAVKAVAPMLEQYIPGRLPPHVLSILDATDPLSVSLAFRGVKAMHDVVASSPVVGKEMIDVYHVPPMALLLRPADALAEN